MSVLLEDSVRRNEVIIFIHGWGLSSKIWAAQVSYFSEKKVINMDLRGHGSREDSAGPYTIDLFAADLKERIEESGIKKPVLVGSSLGGMVVLRSVLSFPGLARMAVLIGSTPCFLKKEGFAAGVSEVVSTRLGMQLLKNHRKRMEYFYDQLFSGEDSRDGYRGGVNQARPLLFEPPPGQVLIDTLEELKRWDIRERVDEIDLPTLIIHGERDAVFAVECARRLGEIRRSRVEIVSGAGHLPFLTRPDEVNKIIEDFISDVSG